MTDFVENWERLVRLVHRHDEALPEARRGHRTLRLSSLVSIETNPKKVTSNKKHPYGPHMGASLFGGRIKAKPTFVGFPIQTLALAVGRNPTHEPGSEYLPMLRSPIHLRVT